MHFHLPKPLHGWRAFAGEVGIIVLGVLIALGLEQVVSAIHDRASAAQTRDSIHAEMADNLHIVLNRQRTEDCLQRRLREIAGFLDARSEGKHPPRPTWIGAPYAPLLGDTSFRSAQSAGKFFLLSQDKQQQIDVFYVDSDDFNVQSTREWYDWAQFRSLTSPGTRLADTEVTRLRQALQDARGADWLVRIDITDFVRLARSEGVTAVRRGGVADYQLASACLPMNMPYAEAVGKTGRDGVPYPE